MLAYHFVLSFNCGGLNPLFDMRNKALKTKQKNCILQQTYTLKLNQAVHNEYIKTHKHNTQRDRHPVSYTRTHKHTHTQTYVHKYMVILLIYNTHSECIQTILDSSSLNQPTQHHDSTHKKWLT